MVLRGGHEPKFRPSESWQWASHIYKNLQLLPLGYEHLIALAYLKSPVGQLFQILAHKPHTQYPKQQQHTGIIKTAQAAIVYELQPLEHKLLLQHN